jgi:hypothetical protein
MDVAFDFCDHAGLSHTTKVMDQFDAAREGELQQLRVALTVNNVNDLDEDGWTALHWQLALC